MSPLAERLARVARRQTLRLTHYGRKSGKAYEVTIWFIVDGENVLLATANRNRQWVKNVRKTPRVKLNIAGEIFEGEARFLQYPVERGYVMQKVRQKYWVFLPFMAAGALLHKFGILQDDTGAFEVSLNG